MAIWEQPQILSGTGQGQVAPTGDIKPELGLCIIHTGTVTTEWALRFRLLQMPSYVYMFNRNCPYDTARELTTRGVLGHNVKYVFHLDSDVIIPANTLPLMIGWMEEFNQPLLSGLYWAKKPSKDPQGNPIPIMPAAWLKTGEHPEENRIDFMPMDIKPHLNTGAIVKADVVGTGCMLIKADIFKQLDESDPKKPYFQWGLGRKDELTGKNLPQMSEDFYFCTRCVKELGIHPHVCTSITCQHECQVVKRGTDGEFELSSVI